MSKYVKAILVGVLLISFSACERKGSLEKAGERADEIVDNVKDGDAPLHKKGAAEKAGEAIDDAVKDVTK